MSIHIMFLPEELLKTDRIRSQLGQARPSSLTLTNTSNLLLPIVCYSILLHYDIV